MMTPPPAEDLLYPLLPFLTSPCTPGLSAGLKALWGHSVLPWGVGGWGIPARTGGSLR